MDWTAQSNTLGIHNPCHVLCYTPSAVEHRSKADEDSVENKNKLKKKQQHENMLMARHCGSSFESHGDGDRLW